MKKNLLALLVCIVISANKSIAQVSTVLLEQKSKDLQPKLQEWRRYLHQHPELSNREYQTAEYVAKYLKSLGLEVHTGIAKTGVVALLKGDKPGPVIALRADMDALPIKEKVNIPFASVDSGEYNGKRVPVMHACGHDSHVAMLMGTATLLSSMKKDMAGTVKFIFQPAEEGAPANEEGGAKLMVSEGVLENPKVDVVFGMHIQSNIEVGRIQYKPGAFMASSEVLTIKVKGKGTHGAMPWSGVDPIQVSAEIINGLQAIVSRQMELTKAPVVISICQINGGVRNNIIADECTMVGTIRTLDTAMLREVHDRIKTTAEKIAESSGAVAEVNIKPGNLIVYNNPELVKNMVPSLEAAVGKENARPMNWATGAEDFCYYGTKAPAFYFYFGGMPKGNSAATAPNHHTSDFYIDDSELYLGVKTFCRLVFDYVKIKS